MKSFLLLFFTLTLSVSATTTSVQIIALRDNNAVLQSYIVRTLNGPDQAMVDTPYTIAEAQAKFPALLGKGESETVKDPSLIIVIYNPDGSIYKVDFQAHGPFERNVKTEAGLSIEATADVAAVKTDIETKTGKALDGKSK